MQDDKKAITSKESFASGGIIGRQMAEHYSIVWWLWRENARRFNCYPIGDKALSNLSITVIKRTRCGSLYAKHTIDTTNAPPLYRELDASIK